MDIETLIVNQFTYLFLSLGIGMTCGLFYGLFLNAFVRMD